MDIPIEKVLEYVRTLDCVTTADLQIYFMMGYNWAQKTMKYLVENGFVLQIENTPKKYKVNEIQG